MTAASNAPSRNSNGVSSMQTFAFLQTVYPARRRIVDAFMSNGDRPTKSKKIQAVDQARRILLKFGNTVAESKESRSRNSGWRLLAKNTNWHHNLRQPGNAKSCECSALQRRPLRSCGSAASLV